MIGISDASVHFHMFSFDRNKVLALQILRYIHNFISPKARGQALLQTHLSVRKNILKVVIFKENMKSEPNIERRLFENLLKLSGKHWFLEYLLKRRFHHLRKAMLVGLVSCGSDLPEVMVLKSL